MKQCFIFFAALAFTSHVAYAQPRTQALCTGDTALITVAGYKGTVKWQQSSNLTTWTDVAGANAATLKAVLSASAYYRAAVQEAAGCPTFYSDTTLVTLWNPTLSVANVKPQTVGTSSFSSSGKLRVQWAQPTAFAANSYEITATENLKNTTVTLLAAAGKTSDTLKGLKSGTKYTVTIKACVDVGCKTVAYCGTAAVGTTGEEYWQLQGTGSTLATLTKVVADGNTLNYAFVYDGAWAPDSVRGYIRYYYNPMNGNEKGMKPARSNQIPQTGDIASAISFTGYTGFGMTYSGYVAGGRSFKTFGQAQAVPYQGKVRVFFEAQTDSDKRTRIYQIDSKDGYGGIDLNAGTSTICKDAADFNAGGNCDYALVLGTENDGTLANPNVTDIRQFKIAYPTQNSWLWDGKAGAFMAATFDLKGAGPGVPANMKTTCAQYRFTTGFATWNGMKWTLGYNGTCPKLFDGMQAPSFVHLGGNRYKLYFNYNKTLIDKQHSPFTDTKPMHVIYAEASGSTMTFEDFEAVPQSRPLHYLWPNGTLLDEAQESKLDDYHFFAPTGNLDFQVQYTNISSSNSIPFVTAAILLNP